MDQTFSFDCSWQVLSFNCDVASILLDLNCKESTSALETIEHLSSISNQSRVNQRILFKMLAFFNYNLAILVN